MLLVTGDREPGLHRFQHRLPPRLEKIVPGRHELAILPGYGHQDLFMGRNVAEDVFPTFLRFLQKHGASRLAAPAAGTAR